VGLATPRRATARGLISPPPNPEAGREGGEKVGRYSGEVAAAGGEEAANSEMPGSR